MQQVPSVVSHMKLMYVGAFQRLCIMTVGGVDAYRPAEAIFGTDGARAA